ncbi:unnamed protein product [Nesidiocoris tenuis]|uniref:Uncharacterized protein n=1 Tax=Nesidiocoris tenuis TaxID=355587 RepID=A0A6H5HVK1_9HEMI|nr:unnamed protein product [Nesidiocoris tenuis]CAB0021103.1 unnamed protein product [Nesidiocoris tenuis]
MKDSDKETEDKNIVKRREQLYRLMISTTTTNKSPQIRVPRYQSPDSHPDRGSQGGHQTEIIGVHIWRGQGLQDDVGFQPPRGGYERATLQKKE